MSTAHVFYQWVQIILLVYSTNCEASKMQIVGANRDVCLEDILTLECTINGGRGGTTVWKGTAFSDCDSNEISLLHRRFRDVNSTSGECNNGAITGRSMRVDGSLYVSQLKVTVKPEMIGMNIECVHDNGTISYAIGRHLLNIVSSWPVGIDWVATLTNSQSQLSFSWSPSISHCPAAEIHYYILSANCGKCPHATTHTSITCTNVPSCGQCVLAIQTTAGEYIIMDMISDPVYIPLNQTRNCMQTWSNNSETEPGIDVNTNKNILNFNTFIAAVVCTAILATTLTLCFTVTITALLLKKKSRNIKSLQAAADSENKDAEKRVYEPVTHHLQASKCTTLENGTYEANSGRHYDHCT